MCPKRFGEGLRERLQHDRLKAYQAYVAERGRQPAGVSELGLVNRRSTARHRLAGVDQDPHGDTRLGSKQLQEHPLETHVRPPVHSAQVVSALEVAMIEELVAHSRVARNYVAADPPAKGLAPADREAFKPLEHLSAQQLRRRSHCYSVALRRA